MNGVTFLYRPLLIGLAFFGLVVVFGATEATASDLDPFQMENNHWISLEHYGENIKHNRPMASEALEEKPDKIDVPGLVPAVSEKNNNEPPSASETATGPVSAPVVAAPKRPLDLPALPTTARGFNVQIDSTSDEKSVEAASPQPVLNTQTGTTALHLQEQNWQEAAEAARVRADHARSANAENDSQPLNVRMSYLPNLKITAKEKPVRPPHSVFSQLPSTPKPPQAEPAKTPAECSAIDTYRKKQLEAIESDRKTLQALQSAISELGLQKQLNFMTNARQGSVLNAPETSPGSASVIIPPPP